MASIVVMGRVGVRAGVSRRGRLWVSAQHVFSIH